MSETTWNSFVVGEPPFPGSHKDQLQVAQAGRRPENGTSHTASFPVHSFQQDLGILSTQKMVRVDPIIVLHLLLLKGWHFDMDIIEFLSGPSTYSGVLLFPWLGNEAPSASGTCFFEPWFFSHRGDLWCSECREGQTWAEGEAEIPEEWHSYVTMVISSGCMHACYVRGLLGLALHLTQTTALVSHTAAVSSLPPSFHVHTLFSHLRPWYIHDRHYLARLWVQDGFNAVLLQVGEEILHPLPQ